MPVEVQFRYGFKSLRLALRFQIVTVSITVSCFSYRYRVNIRLNRNDFVTFHFVPASCDRGLNPDDRCHPL